MTPSPSALLALARQALEVARDGVAALHRLADAAERLAERSDSQAVDGPVMGREAIAEALGISPSTFDELTKTCPPDVLPPSLGKQRKRYWFASAEAARAWFAEVQAARAAPVRRTTSTPRRAAAGPSPAIDLRAVAREAIAARNNL